MGKIVPEPGDESQPVETGLSTNQKETANSPMHVKGETKSEREQVSLVMLLLKEPGENRDRTRLRQQVVHMAVFLLFEQFLWSWKVGIERLK